MRKKTQCRSIIHVINEQLEMEKNSSLSLIPLAWYQRNRMLLSPCDYSVFRACVLNLPTPSMLLPRFSWLRQALCCHSFECLSTVTFLLYIQTYLLALSSIPIFKSSDSKNVTKQNWSIFSLPLYFPMLRHVAEQNLPSLTHQQPLWQLQIARTSHQQDWQHADREGKPALDKKRWMGKREETGLYLSLK